MNLRSVVALSAAGALIAAVVVSAPAQAPPPPTASAQAMAADAAASLVASRPEALHASVNDAFVQHSVISTGGLQYVPYDRTYKGLPVVGGDFVVVTNSAGQVLSTSVAQDATVDLASTTPVVTKDKAESVARGQLSTVDSVSGARLVAFALGTSRLGWETTVTGRGAEGASKLTVVVDAITGRCSTPRSTCCTVTATARSTARSSSTPSRPPAPSSCVTPR